MPERVLPCQVLQSSGASKDGKDEEGRLTVTGPSQPPELTAKGHWLALATVLVEMEMGEVLGSGLPYPAGGLLGDWDGDGDGDVEGGLDGGVAGDADGDGDGDEDEEGGLDGGVTGDADGDGDAVGDVDGLCP